MSLFWCNVVAFLCAIILFGYVLVTLYQLLKGTRKEKMQTLRDFKKGKFALVYIATVPLYLAGYMYNGTEFFEALFSSFARVINLVVLKYEYTGVSALIEASTFFYWVLHGAFFLILLNAITFALSVFYQKIALWFYYLKVLISKKEELYVFGKQKSNEKIYSSSDLKSKLMIGNFSDKEREELYLKKIFSYTPPRYVDIVKKIVKGSKKQKITVIINYPTQDENLALCVRFKKCINELCSDVNMLDNLKIWVFGDSVYEEIYEEIISKSKGCLNFFDRYGKIATDFINRYPITSFMNGDHINYETCFVKDNVDINVLMIGFGKTNRQIFLSSVANNQFITAGEKGAKLKQVNYHVFDKEKSENNKNLNHNYYRLKNEMKELNPLDYLPFPDFPANEIYHTLDINDGSFYLDIKKIIKVNPLSVNVIVIAFGDDLENIDMAKRLSAKVDEWDISNCHIFVKCRNQRNCKEFLPNKNCFFIGSDEQIYNVNEIKGSDLYDMALKRNAVYDLEFSVKENGGNPISEKEIAVSMRKSLEKWYNNKTQAERQSSLYCCLSLRSKLHLLGLDYCELSDEREPITKEQFFKIYAENDMPDTSVYKTKIDGKDIVYYNAIFKESKRKNLAELEHYRWNSFMISKGFIPASKNQILTETVTTDKGTKFTNGKNYKVRRHGNLTTFDGLKTFSDMISKRDGITVQQADVISYDYQILDDAFWLVEKEGFKMVKKSDNISNNSD